MKKSMWLILLFMTVLSTNAQVGKGLGGNAKSGYCTPAPTSVDGSGITNVTFSTVNNTTTDETGHYGDYSAMIGDVQQSATVPVAITYATGYTYDTKIWIDWNDDLDFADAGEEVYSGTSTSSSPTTLNASFIVPLTAVLGHHRMRIGGQDSGPCDPCYNGTYGTYEDYTVNVTAAPTCIAPSALISSNVTTTTADVSWTGAVANYNVDYRVVGAATWTSTTTATNSIALISLNPSSAYEVRVQKDCGSGDLSTWSSTINFNTLCGSTSIPYFESFELITADNQLPNCMQATSIGSKVFTYTSTQSYNRSARTGSKYLSFKYGANDWAFTPSFDLVAGTSYDFTFWYKSDGYSFDTLQVFTGNGQTATAMTTQVGANVLDITNTSYQKFTGTFIPVANGTFNFGIRVATSSDPWYLTIDDIALDITPTCVAPTAVISSNVTSSSADVSWTGAVANYNVDYRIVGEATWTSTTSATNSIALTSLTPSTAYEVRVQKDCGGADLSAWSTILNFNTLCVSITSFPYAENFEGTALPNCWSEARTPASSYGWSSYATGYAGRGVRFDSYDNSEDNVSLLKTQVLDLTSLTTAQMEFWWKNPTGGNFKVVLSTDGGATFPNILADNLTAQSAWVLKTIDLTSYVATGNNVVIGFEGTSNWGNGDAFVYVDNLTIDAIPTCIAPTTLTTSNITGTSIDLSWTGTAANYRVQYRQTGAATWTYTDLIATTTTTISGLTASQSYDFQVRAICSASDSSALTSILVSNTTQIPATVPYSIDFESGATNWSIVNGTEANYWVAGTATANGGTQSVYITNDGTTNDYDVNTSSVAHLYRDITFTPSTIGYTLTFDWKANGEGSSSDYDNLKVFVVDVTTTPVAGAELTSGLVGEDWYNLQTTWQNGSISLPATLSGTTKRLVFSWTNDGSDGTTPPAAIDNVSIVEATLVSCETPTALAATNVAETTADLGWTSTAANFNVRYRTVGAATWTNTTASANTLALTSLTNNTQYEFQVQAVCSATAGDTSAWATEVNFTTLATLSCATPTALAATNVAETTADLGWTSTAANFNVRYRTVGAATWTSTTASANTLALTSLTANTQYEFQVQAVCSATAGDTSYWATAVTFTTLATPTCPDPTALVVSAINAAGASLSWTNGGTETAWNIRYKKSTDATYTNVNNTTTKPYVLTALSANTAYVWSVQAICSVTLNSGWATENTFTTTVGVEENASADLTVYSHNNQINVLNNGNTLVKEVAIYDMLGQQVGAYAINSNDNIFINTNLTVGNYVVKVVTEKHVMTKKLLVK